MFAAPEVSPFGPVAGGALTTPGYCIAGALEIFEETEIELAAADDALDRAGEYTARLRPALLDG